MPFEDWDDVAGISLPISGKTYAIRPLNRSQGLKLEVAEEAVADGAPLEDQMSNEDFQRLLLGPMLDEMRGDDVPDTAILRAALTAHAAHKYGIDVAEHMWKHGPSPEALAASMKAATEGSTISPATAAGRSSTKKPASTSGTTSKRQPARKSPGRRSATSGR